MSPVRPKKQRKQRSKIPSVQDFYGYEREPIKIGHGSVMLLQMFKSRGHIEDCWTTEFLEAQHYGVYDTAARQFILQLEGEATIAFYMALRDQLNVEIKNWRDRCRRLKK